MDIEKELELVEKAKKDIRAFDSLYKLYFPRIYAYCLNRTFNREICEDVVSEVFFSAVKSLNSFNTKRGIKFSAWLYTVAHNKIVDYYRKNKRHGGSIEKIIDTLADKSDLDKSVVDSELQKKVAVVMSKVKPRYQEIISLRYYSDLTNDEIADVLKVNKKHIALLIHRALKSFKEKFEKIYPTSEIYDLL